MKFTLFSAEKWDDNWDISIFNIDTSYWEGSLFSIWYWESAIHFDLLWLRSIIVGFLNK